MAQGRELHPPAITPETKPFFDAAARGVLMLKYCDDCQRHHHYPRALCPHCFSERTRWTEASGNGRIYTFSVLRAGTPTPFALAYVQLEEGPRMMTNVVDCDLDALDIDQPVRVVFKPTTNGTMIPMFTPTMAGAAT
ncbi:Zn-ribbon domain-containing OB-fold protein [Verticiella sediminum]|uniref:Zn-ribbon domain-containing OB-fold protein n=1 Tax=Verticiella sediminum TaxID=1247510 RepID=A0A556B0G7_9BURK|nr:Zn-ribbon domain-containing OB-fold protein [Verticiella sediminum]